MIFENLIDDRQSIHFAYFSGDGKLAAMEPDRRNLLQNFDDPPAHWGCLLGGLVVLFLLLAGVTSWDLVRPALRAVFRALAG